MTGREKVDEAAEEFARTMVGTHRALAGYVAGVQARNLGFVRDVVVDTTAEMRRQAEANRALARGLAEQAGEQSDIFWRIVEASFEAYRSFLHAPAHGGEGPNYVATATTDVAVGGESPIEGYDELSVKKISERLDMLSVGELERIRAYVEKNKNRESLLKQIERRTRAISS